MFNKFRIFISINLTLKIMGLITASRWLFLLSSFEKYDKDNIKLFILFMLYVILKGG